MIYRIYPDKDTFISNAVVASVQQTGSNYGYAESLEVFKIAGVSGAQSVLSGSQLSRILIHFQTASLDNFLSTNPVSSAAKSYRLFMQHETTGDGLPQAFTLRVRAVSGSWLEGRGIDTVDRSDYGVANWWKFDSSNFWVQRGGDCYASPDLSQTFDIGDENLDLDVTDAFNLWSSGTRNDGFCISLASAHESDTVYDDFYKKSFYSRHTQWDERKPYVEVRWNDFIGDDRSKMTWGMTGSLFLHNIVDGQYTALSIGQSALIVSISDLSGTITRVTASATQLVGIYSASICLPSASYSGSIFYDSWGSSSFAFMTGSFTFKSKTAYKSSQTQQYTVNVPNIREFYDAEEVVRFNVNIRSRSYRQGVVATASLRVTPDIVEKCYYSIENESTRRKVIPFGTGSQQHTRLSYDENGNYFMFPMTNLHSGEVYRLYVLVDRDGQRQIIDCNSKFRVK
jgi:hypothetical protein